MPKWLVGREDDLIALVRKHGPDLTRIAAEMGTTRSALDSARCRDPKLGARWKRALGERALGTAPVLVPDTPTPAEAQLMAAEDTNAGSARELSSNAIAQSRPLELDAFLECAAVDRATWEVERYVINRWGVGAKGPDGRVVVTPIHQIKVWLRRLKDGQLAPEALAERVVARVNAIPFRGRMPSRFAPTSLGPVLHVVAKADAHFGKLGWQRETGHLSYDLKVAARVDRDATLDAMARSSRVETIGRRLFAFVGDVFHYDTRAGTTTGGTAMDRDSRPARMIDVAVDSIVEQIDASVAEVPTDVVVLPGNHDWMLSLMLRRVLRERYRNAAHVRVFDSAGIRQYHEFGKVLLGFTHGDMVKLNHLGLIMAQEQSAAWGRTIYREWITGDKHMPKRRDADVVYKDRENSETGVRIRIAEAPCPPDLWHAQMGYVGNAFTYPAVQSWLYHADGFSLGGVYGAARVEPPTPGTMLDAA